MAMGYIVYREDLADYYAIQYMVDQNPTMYPIGSAIQSADGWAGLITFNDGTTVRLCSICPPPPEKVAHCDTQDTENISAATGRNQRGDYGVYGINFITGEVVELVSAPVGAKLNAIGTNRYTGDSLLMNRTINHLLYFNQAFTTLTDLGEVIFTEPVNSLVYGAFNTIDNTYHVSDGTLVWIIDPNTLVATVETRLDMSSLQPPNGSSGGVDMDFDEAGTLWVQRYNNIYYSLYPYNSGYVFYADVTTLGVPTTGGGVSIQDGSLIGVDNANKRFYILDLITPLMTFGFSMPLEWLSDMSGVNLTINTTFDRQTFPQPQGYIVDTLDGEPYTVKGTVTEGACPTP